MKVTFRPLQETWEVIAAEDYFIDENKVAETGEVVGVVHLTSMGYDLLLSDGSFLEHIQEKEQVGGVLDRWYGGRL